MKYELVCIFSPKMTEKELEKEIDNISKLLQKIGAEKVESSNWGKKSLAYEINKFTDGYYVQYNFLVETENVKEINKKLKLEDNIIRFLIVNQESFKEPVKSNQKEKEDAMDSLENKKIKNKEEKNSKEKKSFDKTLEEALDSDVTV